jgi:aminopeptidase N
LCFPAPATEYRRPNGSLVIRTLTVIGLALLWASTSLASAPESAARPGRLPTGIVPVHYDIHVEPDAAALTTRGTVSIDVVVERPTDTVVLNALDLEIHSVLADAGNPADVRLDASAQTATLRFARSLSAGPHRLRLEYTGKIEQTASGLFAVDYPAEGGERRMLTTQFEVGDARRFAPMWDEPSAKATFTLEVVIPKGQAAYSNMPVESSAEANGKQVVRFATSPKMSSYLLHLTAGDLERISRKAAGVEIGIVTRKGATEKGRFALDAAVEILPWYNDYFGTPYPLPKLDMIAVPGTSQFFGAMENWGAIMYFEQALLMDPRLSSESDRLNVYDAVAHEMAHQWFGNLVTMEWWDDLWLNEGYATWMAEKAATTLRPQWNVPLLTVKWPREYALQSDASDATHPVVQPVVSMDAASQAFDSIAYNKGSAVVRMLEASLGETGFRDGIRRYMRRYAYGNAVTDQLWSELATATNRPVIDIARDFTLQPGVPLVKAEAGRCESGRTRVTLTQGRFEAGTPSPARLTWRIPVTLQAVDTKATASALLGKDGAPVSVEVGGCGPVVVNAGQTGYFRTQYADADLARIRENFGQIAEVDRLGLLNDAAALSKAGRIPATSYLDLVAAIPTDSHPVILLQLTEEFAVIDRLMTGSAQQAAWRSYARDRLHPVFDRVGWLPGDGEAQAVALLRESLIETLGRLEDPAVIAGARERFARAATDPAAMPASIHDAVLEIVAKHADSATWEEIRSRAKSAQEPTERQLLLAALGLPLDTTLAARALDLALAPETPTVSVAEIMRGVSFDHPEQAFDFAVTHDRSVLEHVEGPSKWDFISSLAGTSTDRAVADKVQSYMERSIPKDARETSKRVIASIKIRAGVKERQVPALEAWLQKQPG